MNVNAYIDVESGSVENELENLSSTEYINWWHKPYQLLTDISGQYKKMIYFVRPTDKFSISHDL